MPLWFGPYPGFRTMIVFFAKLKLRGIDGREPP